MHRRVCPASALSGGSIAGANAPLLRNSCLFRSDRELGVNALPRTHRPPTLPATVHLPIEKKREILMRLTVSTLAAVLALMISAHIANAQQLKATPKSSQGLFCTLCKAQGCSCNSDSTQCTNCGANLKAKSATATSKACTDAKGRLANGRCQLK